jgi:hypothetical protein
MITDHVARCLLDLWSPGHPGHGAACAVLAGDSEAAYLLQDLVEEEGLLMNPFVEGKAYLICTVTLYYVGRVKQVGLGWLVLEKASWIHWTGRLSVLLAEHDFKSSRLSTRKPRVEYCGEVILSTSAIVSSYPWPVEGLPTGSIE